MYETEHVVWAIKRANRLKIATCRRDEETEKYKKKGEQKSQKCDISPLCGGAPCEPISTKFVVFVGLINVITCAKNGFKTYIGFSRPTGGKSMFPYRKPTAYITLPCATALACDSTSLLRPHRIAYVMLCCDHMSLAAVGPTGRADRLTDTL